MITQNLKTTAKSSLFNFNVSEELCEDPMQTHRILPHSHFTPSIYHLYFWLLLTYLMTLLTFPGGIFQNPSVLSILSILNVIVHQWDFQQSHCQLVIDNSVNLKTASSFFIDFSLLFCHISSPDHLKARKILCQLHSFLQSEAGL